MRVLYLKGKSRSGDRSYRLEGEVAIGRSLLQGRCQEREVAIGGSWHLWRKSRSGDRSYRGGVRRERSPLGEVGIHGGSRDREIAPTGEVSGERSPLGEVGIYGRSRSGDRSYRKLDRKTYIKVEYIKREARAGSAGNNSGNLRNQLRKPLK